MLEPTTTKSESAASQNNRFLSSSSSQLGWQEVAAGSCYAAMLTSCCTVVICSQKRTFSFGIMRANYVRLPASCFEPPRCRLLCHLHVHCARCSSLMIHSACWIVTNSANRQVFRFMFASLAMALVLSILVLSLQCAGIDWSPVLTLGGGGSPTTISQALKQCACAAA